MKHQLIVTARKYEFGQCAKINGAKINRAKKGSGAKKNGIKVYMDILLIHTHRSWSPFSAWQNINSCIGKI